MLNGITSAEEQTDPPTLIAQSKSTITLKSLPLLPGGQIPQNPRA